MSPSSEQADRLALTARESAHSRRRGGPLTSSIPPVRTTVGLALALSVIGPSALSGVSVFAGAEPPADTTTTTTSTTSTAETTTSTSTTTTSSTTTSLPANAQPAVPSLSGGAIVDAATMSTEAPAEAVRTAEPVAGLPRQDGQIQLTEPPPTPPPPTTAPPDDQLPENSGTGRRVVYSKTLQRVWAVDADGNVEKTHLVSGRRTWNQPSPAEYKVFSRSSFTCNIKDPSICWRYMIRFTVGPDGDNIGFHEIPNKNGVPVQSIAQLGTPLSGGCVRQATPDAQWMWSWAGIGTKVVVLP